MFLCSWTRPNLSKAAPLLRRRDGPVAARVDRAAAHALGANGFQQVPLVRSLAAYTDDFKFRIVGIGRAIRTISVWYELTRELNLRMAIPAKREAGTSALWLWLCGYAALGYEAIPRAKQPRAISMLSSISEQRGMRNNNYAQLRGLLQHLVPFSLGTYSMYHMHAPATAAAHLCPAGWMSADDEMLEQVTAWITTLTTRPGVSVLVTVSELETGPTDDEAASATLWKMSSDAAKDGTNCPAIAGYMHGASWAIALRPCDVAGPLQISIPVLEFLAIAINFIVFGPRIPTGVRIVVMTDSPTSVDVLADGTTHAPLMQWLHTRLLADDHFKRLAPLALIGHGYGETNAMSDARSRGYGDLVARIRAALRVRHVALDTPSAAALELLDALRAEDYARLSAVDGKRTTDDDSSEPTADSTERRAVDPFGNGVRIGKASNEGPTPMQTPAAARRKPLAQSPTPPAPKRVASPPDARGSPTPPAPLKRALGNRSPTVFSARCAADAAGAAAGAHAVAEAVLRRTDHTRAWRAPHATRRHRHPGRRSHATGGENNARVTHRSAPSTACLPVARGAAAPSAAAAAARRPRLRATPRSSRNSAPTTPSMRCTLHIPSFVVRSALPP